MLVIVAGGATQQRTVQAGGSGHGSRPRYLSISTGRGPQPEQSCCGDLPDELQRPVLERLRPDQAPVKPGFPDVGFADVIEVLASCLYEYQLVRAGLAGKGVPESVGMYPAVFATFTAPSCGSCIPGL